MRVKVKVVGQEAAAAKIKSLAQKIQDAIKDRTAEAGIEVQANAKEACPVDTGRLRSSIQLVIDNEGSLATVTTDVEYAPYVEFGTKRITEQPFLFPAWEKEKPLYIADIEKILNTTK